MPDQEKSETAYIRHHIYVEILASWLWVAEDSEGELYFPLNASCEALEVETRAAHDLIRRDTRIQPGVCEIRLPTAGGEQVQKCLRSTEYAWWLALVDPPRSAAPEQRALLIERQRVLMGLARDILLRGRELDVLPSFSRRQVTSTQFAPASLNMTDTAVTGAIEANFRCLICGAPHVMVIDGKGWHLHVGVEVES